MLPVRFYCVQHPSAPVGVDGFRFLQVISELTPTLAIGIGGGYLDCRPWSEVRDCFQRTELAGLTAGFINFVSCLTDYPFGGAMRHADLARGTAQLRVPPSTAFGALHTPGVPNVALVSAPPPVKPEEALRAYDAVLCTEVQVQTKLWEQGIPSALVPPDPSVIKPLLEEIVSNHTEQEKS